MADPEGIAECFDRCARARRRRRRRRPGALRGVSRTLLELLEARGLAGATVLDLGCGLGALARETVSRGASRATGLDLSPVSVGEAARLAAAAGLADRTSFAAGDGATVPLEPHDVVVLDKVICCYPAVDALLANSLGAARRTYAFVAPVSWGWRGVTARVGLAFGNAFLRASRQRYRAFVHDLRKVEARVREAGFERVATSRRTIWFVGLYARPSDVPARPVRGVG